MVQVVEPSGNRGSVIGRGPIPVERCQQSGAHITAESPRQSGIHVIFVVGAIDPSKGLGIPVGRVTRRRSELLDENRVVRCSNGDIRVPTASRHSLVVVDVVGIEDTVTGCGVGQCVGVQLPEVIGIRQTPRDDDVIGICITYGRQEGLHPGASEVDAASATGRLTVPPDAPVGRVRFVIDIEQDRRVVGVGRRHGGPQCHRVHVRHGLLLGRSTPPTPARGGRRSGSSGPMQIQIQVHVGRGTIVDDRLDHFSVRRLVGRPLGVRTSEPKILIDGQTDTVGVPDRYRFRDDGDVIRHRDAADDRRGISRPGITRRTVFQTGNVDALQTNRTTPARGHDLVSLDLQLGRRGPNRRA